MHMLIFGILLGLGAAIPIGPVNLEMIRRNLRFGTPYGLMLGFGACTADVTYLALLCLGALTLLQFPDVLRALGFVGSFVLAWFGISALRSKLTDTPEHKTQPSLLRYGFEGYVITMLNPFTILFWISVSSQISAAAVTYEHAILFAGAGVIIGTVSWVLFLNLTLHVTRHRLSKRVIQGLNYLGGFILLGFAAAGIIRFINSF